MKSISNLINLIVLIILGLTPKAYYVDLYTLQYDYLIGILIVINFMISLILKKKDVKESYFICSIAIMIFCMLGTYYNEEIPVSKARLSFIFPVLNFDASVLKLMDVLSAAVFFILVVMEVFYLWISFLRKAR